jgi:hypothetical protein
MIKQLADKLKTRYACEKRMAWLTNQDLEAVQEWYRDWTDEEVREDLALTEYKIIAQANGEW